MWAVESKESRAVWGVRATDWHGPAATHHARLTGTGPRSIDAGEIFDFERAVTDGSQEENR